MNSKSFLKWWLLIRKSNFNRFLQESEKLIRILPMNLLFKWFQSLKCTLTPTYYWEASFCAYGLVRETLATFLIRKFRWPQNSSSLLFQWLFFGHSSVHWPRLIIEKLLAVLMDLGVKIEQNYPSSMWIPLHLNHEALPKVPPVWKYYSCGISSKTG